MADAQIFNKIYIKDDSAGIDKTILISTTADKVFFENGTSLASVISTINGSIGTINTNIGTINTNIGSLSSLKTSAKGNIVSSINEVKDRADGIGTLSSLQTSAKGNLVAAINEVKNAAKPAFVRSSTAPSDTSVFWIDTNATTGGLKAYWSSAWRPVSVQYT